MFPVYSQETIEDFAFHLCWQQHGGSGLNVTLSEVLNLIPLGRLQAWVDRVDERRQAEADAIRKASK